MPSVCEMSQTARKARINPTSVVAEGNPVVNDGKDDRDEGGE